LQKKITLVPVGIRARLFSPHASPSSRNIMNILEHISLLLELTYSTSAQEDILSDYYP
jgi:hypothetical protein